MRSIRTDLALELHELLMEAAEEISGITLSEQTDHNVTISRVLVESDEAEQKIGKPKGTYVNLSLPDLRSLNNALYEYVCKKIAEELQKMLTRVDATKPILVIGLGNRAITSDALGPSVVDRLMVTRHLFESYTEELTKNLSSVCAIAPGVLGVTGIETGEIISAICKAVQPSAVICIDALAARHLNRVIRTVQISDTGICPGAGVGNNRTEISEKTLGVPVMAIGVPTVVDAATITDNTLSLVIQNLLTHENENTPFFKMISELKEDDRYQLLHSTVSEALPNFFTTPKEIDLYIGKAAELVANGLNFALHKEITFSDISMFIS